MIEQYPHTLTYASPGTPDVYDEDTGEWIPGTPGASVTVRCRAVPSGIGKVVRNQDGASVEYDYDLVFPLEVDGLENNQQVTILDQNGHVKTEGHLIRFERGQLHNRGWI